MRACGLALLALAGCFAHAPAVQSTPVDAYSLPLALQADPNQLKFAPLRFEPPEPRVEKLPNGLVIYLLEDRAVPLVQLHAVVKVGNLDDPPDKVGLAQVMWAALQTGGAGRLGADQVDQQLENMAALLDGEVDDEESDLALEARTADLDKAMPLFVDLLRRPRFEAKALARVLDQGRDAVARRRDDAGHVGQVAFAQAVWGEASPFAREPRLSTLAQVARDDLLALHEAALVPGSVRLVVTGDFDADTVLGQLRALLADWSPGPGVSRKLPQAPAPNGRQVIIVPTTSAQAKVRLGHLGPARHDPRDFALKLLDSLLGGSGGPSRLYTEIRDKRGLAYSVDSSIGTGLVRGLVVMAADTKPENTREVIARCIETMEAVRGAAPPTDEEITLAREGFINAYAFRFDTAARAAHLRALSDFEGYPADYFRTFREKLSKVTSAEVGQVAREVLDPNSLQIVVVGDPQRMGDLSEFGPVRTVLGDFEPPGE